MSNPYFDWPSRSVADRFARFDTVRAEDANDAFDLASAGFEKMPIPAKVWGAYQNYADAGGAVNAWTATIANTYITAYSDGLTIRVKFPAANTNGVPTLNLNGLGAKTICRGSGVALSVSDITAGMVGELTYNGTFNRWQLSQSPVGGSSDINASNLAAPGGSTLVGFIHSGVGAEPRTQQDKSRDIAALLDYVPEEERDAIREGTSTYNATAAINAAFAEHYNVDFGREGWLFNVSTITVPTGCSIVTRGRGPTIQQIAGGSPIIRPITIGGSNTSVGDLEVVGNIDTDTGEQLHGIFLQANATTGNIENVLIGNIRGRNIRGDLVYCGHTLGYTLINYHVGHIYGDNILRNVMSAVSGTGGSVKSIDSGRVGFCALDVEPNAGHGTGTAFRCGYVRGRVLGLNAQTAADYLDGIHIGVADLSPSYSAQSSVPYAPGVGIEDGVLLRNIKSAKIDYLKLEGYNRSGIFTTYNVGELGCQMLEIGSLYMRNCSITDAVYNAYVVGGNVTRLLVHYVDVVIAATKRAFSGIDGSTILGALADIQGSGVFVYDSDDMQISNVRQTGAGGFFLQTCLRAACRGGSFSGARLVATNSNKCVFEDMTITATTAVYPANTEEHQFNRCTINGVYVHGIGGPGGAVAQATNKNTGVTLNTRNGQITMEATSAIAAGAIASFTLTSDKILANDIVDAQRKSGGTAGAYRVWCDSVAAGSCVICVENRTAGSLSEAVVLQFIVRSGAIA